MQYNWAKNAKYCFECQNKNKKTIFVHNMFWPCLFWGNWMSNLLSYCGLTDARMRASEKDLPVWNQLRFFQVDAMPLWSEQKRNLVELIYAEIPINSCMNVLIFFYCTLLKMFLIASASKVLQLTRFLVIVAVVVVPCLLCFSL